MTVETSAIPPDCPRCHGQTEWENHSGGTYRCFFCGEAGHI